MTFARRLKRISLVSVTLLAAVAGLLVWSSERLKEAERDSVLADEIQSTLYQRATLRDEYLLHGLARARLQWLSLNREAAGLIDKGNSRFPEEKEQQVLRRVREEFDDSMLVSQRLVGELQRLGGAGWDLVHHDELANRLYLQIMLRDSAIQRAALSLQRLTRERFTKAIDRTVSVGFLLVLVVVVATTANAVLINNLLRRRLAMLKHATAVLASGDFGYRMNCQGTDELAELAVACDSVAEKVEGYTRQLSESYQLMHDLSSQVPGILFQAHLAPDGAFRTPYVSRGLDEVCPGGARDGEPFFACLQPSAYPGILASFLESAALGHPWEHEFRVSDPQGEARWLRGQARSARQQDGGTIWHGFIYDVTERKLMEEAPSQSEERFRLQLQELSNIYSMTPVGLFAVDRQLRYLRLNERMADFNCKRIEEHLGRTIDELHPPGFVAVLKEMWRPVIERGEPIYNLEVQGQEDWPSGLRHWLVSFQPLVAESGEVIGLTGSVLDITQRKNAEQMMAGARQQLEQEVKQRTAKLSLTNQHLLQEIEVRKKVEFELLAQQQKLQELALDVAMAEERERDRIASELHDQVGQRLILAKIKLDTLASSLTGAEFEEEAVGVETLIEQTIQDIRSLTFQIRPPLLASAGLEAALRWLGEELQADFGLEVHFEDDGKEKPLRYEIRSTVFQAVRELMLNVAKHAGTRRCRVTMSRNGEMMVIEVEDGGVGIKPGAGEGGSARSGGFGLSNVRQKIQHLGGSFSIDAKPTGGTLAALTVPLQGLEPKEEKTWP